MENDGANARRVKFWTRVVRNGKERWQLVEGRDESDVPEACWRKFNAAFWRRLRDGALKPADPLACYQDGCAAMIAAAAQLSGADRVVLRHASPVTYITSAGLVRMRQFVRETVAPKRDEQSQMFDKCRVNGVLDIRAYVENLPSLLTLDAALADDLARECVAETLAKCTEETRLALRGYMAWNLCAEDAAHALGMKRQTFAWQRDHKWFPEFRRNCVWSW